MLKKELAIKLLFLSPIERAENICSLICSVLSAAIPVPKLALEFGWYYCLGFRGADTDPALLCCIQPRRASLAASHTNIGSIPHFIWSRVPDPGGHQDMSMGRGLDPALLMPGLKQPLTSAGKGETFTPQNLPGLLWSRADLWEALLVGSLEINFHHIQNLCVLRFFIICYTRRCGSVLQLILGCWLRVKSDQIPARHFITWNWM